MQISFKRDCRNVSFAELSADELGVYTNVIKKEEEKGKATPFGFARFYHITLQNGRRVNCD